MKHDGLTFKLAPHLSWRKSDPERDVDLRGNPVKSYYVAIVSKKDCPYYVGEDGKQYIHTDNAPSVPIDHGGTYYGYGKERKSWRGYTTIPVYLVRGNRVYTATIRRNK